MLERSEASNNEVSNPTRPCEQRRVHVTMWDALLRVQHGVPAGLSRPAFEKRTPVMKTLLVFGTLSTPYLLGYHRVLRISVSDIEIAARACHSPLIGRRYNDTSYRTGYGTDHEPLSLTPPPAAYTALAETSVGHHVLSVPT